MRNRGKTGGGRGVMTRVYRVGVSAVALAKEAGSCETPAISAPGLLRPKPGAKWMRQRSKLGEHRYVRQYALSP
jgi:hypothetical protein